MTSDAHGIVACGALAGWALLAAHAVGAADPARMDWSAVPASEILLFYPGQASYQWLRSAEHRSGAVGVKAGRHCLDCHRGEEAEIGDKIVGGKRLEPRPIAGLPGTVRLTLQAAYDREHLYLRASWPAKGPGIFHEYSVFRGGKWEEPYGSHRGSDAVREGRMPPSYEDRFSIMIGDAGNLPAFAKEGCWVTCHDDMRFMPRHPARAEVEAHPVLGKAAMNKRDIRKYLPQSRDGANGGWDRIRPRGEIAALEDKGVFLDLWQWRANRSNFARMADDGYVLEYRNADGGIGMFAENWDAEARRPRLMFDPKKRQGRAALAGDEFRKPGSPHILVDSEAVPFDPKFPFQDGDLIPLFNGVAQPRGSVADNRPVVGTHAAGRWTVTWKRRLDTGNAKDDVILKAGRAYPIGLAIHEDNTTARWHYVSFPLTLGIGARADISAVELK